MDWKNPVTPTFTHLFLEDVIEGRKEAGPKAKAFETPFRYSDAGKCMRAMAYNSLGLEGEPFDGPSTLVTEIGSWLHEQIQTAIKKKYPDATFEGKSKLDLSSGHFDGLVPNVPGLGKVLLEFKSMGGTGYAKSIGAGARGMNAPQGPRFSAVAQSALNALANDCDTIVIGHIATEAISRQKAERLDLDEWKRCIAEWVIPKSVWTPIAYAEVARQMQINDHLEADELPYRVALSDAGMDENLDPTSGKSWQCVYCSYAGACLSDGPGTPVNIHKKEK